MARELGSNYKKTTYLTINKDGFLQESVKEPKEGYEEYTTPNGIVRYRKLYAGTDFGYITSIKINEVEYTTGKEKRVSITVENETARDVLQFRLFSIKGGLTDIVRKLIAVLPNIDFSREITISANKKKNDRGYVDKVLFFNYVEGGETTEPVKFALKFGKEGDVPMFTTKTNKMTGDIEYDFTAQDEYLYDILMEQIARLDVERPSVPNAPVDKPAESNVGQKPSEKNQEEPSKSILDEVIEEDDDDDLPF